jgi:hypothetical protein
VYQKYSRSQHAFAIIQESQKLIGHGVNRDSQQASINLKLKVRSVARKSVHLIIKAPGVLPLDRATGREKREN